MTYRDWLWFVLGLALGAAVLWVTGRCGWY